MGSDTYGIRIKCDNCGSEDQISIPNGVTGKEFFQNKKCFYCSCVNCIEILPFER